MSHFSLGQFYGADTLIDSLIFFVSVLVAVQSYSIYNLIGEKRFKYFSYSFFLISAGLIFKVLSNLTLAYRYVFEDYNVLTIIVREFQEMHYINFISLQLYKIFMLAGFLVLFFVVTRKKKRDLVLLLYLSLIAIVFSIYFNFIYYTTLLSILIVLSSCFYSNHKHTKTINSKLSFFAFLFLTIGITVEIFSVFHGFIYIFGEVFLLAGFVIILINHLKIKNDKKN